MGKGNIYRSTIQSPADKSRLTQADKIENLLRSRYGQWIPAYELSDLALQYCARINAIRKKLRAADDTEEIQNRTEWVDGQCHGSYRICPKDGPTVKTETPAESAYMRRVRQEQEKAAPLFAGAGVRQ